MAAHDHSYAARKMEVGSSERTRGLGIPLGAERDAETVDLEFLKRAGPQWQDVIRPVQCLIDYQDHRRTAHLSWEPFLEIADAARQFGGFGRYLDSCDGALIKLAWPVDKSLRLTSTEKLGYRDVLEGLRRDYRVLTRERLEVLGVALSPGQSLYSDRHPVLLLAESGGVYVHVRASPSWTPGFDPERDGERLYVAAPDLRVLAKEGLVRCDDLYTEAGGAPYAMPEDAAVKDLSRVSCSGLAGSCGASSGSPTVRLLRVLETWEGHRWFMNGCPGMMKDRVFVISREVSPYAARLLAENHGPRFRVVGRMCKTPEDPVGDCEFYVLLDADGAVFAYAPETAKIRQLARTFDSFMRVGSRRMHFNFQLVRHDRSSPFDEPTFHPPLGCGFYLLSRELISVRRVR